MGFLDFIIGKTYVCDVCGELICDPFTGNRGVSKRVRDISKLLDNHLCYILETPEVLYNESYWRFYFKDMHPEIQRADRQGKCLPLLVKELAEISGASHGWLVCRNCYESHHFDQDRTPPRQNAWGIVMDPFPQADFEKTLAITACAWNSVYGYPPVLSYYWHKNSLFIGTEEQKHSFNDLSRAEIAECELKKMRNQ
jgi:hypothetical protein